MSLDKSAQQLNEMLSLHRLTICTAESCTGGLLASTITDIPGSSNHFLGGAVAYANEVKVQLLAVPHSYIVAFGAVSAPVALAMAKGARDIFHCDIALSTTGIAGPGGGTADKPVGLVFIAIAASGFIACRRCLWPYDRSGNKLATTEAAIELALEYLDYYTFNYPTMLTE